MLFWDASAIVPLIVHESRTVGVRTILRADGQMIVWWGTELECLSALARREREGSSTATAGQVARAALKAIASGWLEIEPTHAVRTLAGRVLQMHRLRAPDALQLAAAQTWRDSAPGEHTAVCLDDRLREALTRDGFRVIPA